MSSKTIFTAALIGFVVGILFLAAFMAASALPAQDMASYWAGAHLVRQNPYSSHLTAELERKSGIAVLDPPLVMRNPPWAIPFILPLGFFSYRVGFAIWTVFSVAVVLGSVAVIWQLFEKPASIFVILMPLLFGPTIVLLELGQWTVLVLLGITCFLVAINHEKDWIAGASLVLLFGKPHVTLLFLVVVALWTIQNKRWAVAYGAALSLIASSLTTLMLNRQVFEQFVEHSREVVDERVRYPNIGGLLYDLTGNHLLALLPQAIGILWLLFYWIRNRAAWDWKTNGMIVLVCSIVCSYYSYPYDQVILLPALVTAFVTGNRRIFLAGFIATNLGFALYIFNIAGRFGFGYMFLWWTATAWLITYLASRPTTRRLDRKELINA